MFFFIVAGNLGHTLFAALIKSKLEKSEKTFCVCTNFVLTILRNGQRTSKARA